MDKKVEEISQKLDEAYSEVGISANQVVAFGLDAHPMGLVKPEKDANAKTTVIDADSVTGVLMAIDDINRTLNQYDAVARRLNAEGKPDEAREVKDMADAERKNKVRLREILKSLGSD